MTALAYARRMEGMKASEIRELLKLVDRPDVISFAGGIPDPALFPAEAARAERSRIPDSVRQIHFAVMHIRHSLPDPRARVRAAVGLVMV